MPQEDGDERDHDSDVILSLIQLLSLGPAVIPTSGAVTTAAALLRAVSLGGGGEGAEVGGPSVAMVRDASVALSAIVEASSPEALAAAAAGAPPGGSAGGGAPLRRTTDHSQGGAGGAPALAPANGRAGGPSAGGAGPAPASPFAGTAGAERAQQPGGGLSPRSGGGAEVSTPDPRSPQAMLPSVVTDHSTGLAVLRTWSGARAASHAGPQWGQGATFFCRRHVLVGTSKVQAARCPRTSSWPQPPLMPGARAPHAHLSPRLRPHHPSLPSPHRSAPRAR
jgi:hypothetical protein